MKKLYFTCICLIVIGLACKKRETDIAVEACSMDIGFTDSSNIHPKHLLYKKLIDSLTRDGLPGVSLMIEDASGLWMGSSGYADIKHHTPMQTCHLGKIASVTKLFTAVMIYQLAEQNKLSLSDKISAYIDDKIVSRIENADQATIADLLSHSSGIYDVVFDPEFILYTFNNLDKDKSYQKLLQFAYGKKADFVFRSKRSYNQTLNHVLLAMIIEKVTGADQSVWLHQHIIAPLHLQHTYIRPQDDLPWNFIAKGYYDYRKKGVLQDLTPLFTGDGRGFTGIYTQVNDLRIFTNALFREKTLMQTSSLAHMMDIPTVDSTLACAGGCRAMQIVVDGNKYTWYGHPGGEVNYAAGAFYCPEIKATITYTVNYGVAFTDMGAYTDAYYSFRKKLFEVVSRPN